MNGWDQDVLERALKSCTNLSGNIKDCAVFDGQLQDANNGCKKTEFDFPDEDCEGPIKELPGNNPIGDAVVDDNGTEDDASPLDDVSSAVSDDSTPETTEAASSSAPAASSPSVEAAAVPEQGNDNGAATVTVTSEAPAVYETQYVQQSYKKRAVNQHHRRHNHAHRH